MLQVSKYKRHATRHHKNMNIITPVADKITMKAWEEERSISPKNVLIIGLKTWR
jgi:hypothetical protein